MTKKSGLSKCLMEMVHEGMTSSHGLTRTVEHIRRRQEKRYYKLLCIFADRVAEMQLINPLYLAPTPPSVAQYSRRQKPVGAETLSAAWMQSTEIYSAMCEQSMSSLKVKKVLRVDHSVKFCKRLKVWTGATGKRESISDARMLLLIQNEIGQIVGRRLTRSEKDDKTRELLELEQINRGDLYVPSNTFSEGGGGDVRIVSTSQLQGFHSALKKVLDRSVSVDVGLRVLDFFILQHNLKLGTKFGRNPPLQHADSITLTRTATLCRGVLPDSPQLEFANELISKSLQRPKYRSATSLDFGFVQWKLMFETARVDTQTLEHSLQQAHQHRESIRELLSKQIAFTESGKLPKEQFLNSLCLDELDYEAAAGFSGEEYALLSQVRKEQIASGQSWAECALVTTIMFNIAASSNSNYRLKVRRRSFATLATKVDSTSAATLLGKQPAIHRKIFRFSRPEPRDENSPRELELQIQLFTELRKMGEIRKKRQVFAMVYDFACSFCTGIFSKSRTFLYTRWDNLKHKTNKKVNLKIKLKLPPKILSNIQAEATSSTDLQPFLNVNPPVNSRITSLRTENNKAHLLVLQEVYHLQGAFCQQFLRPIFVHQLQALLQQRQY